MKQSSDLSSKIYFGCTRHTLSCNQRSRSPEGSDVSDSSFFRISLFHTSLCALLFAHYADWPVGKSVLSTRIVTFLEKAPDTLLLRHFCSHHYSSSVQYGNILASILHQLLRDKDDLLAYVYTGYILARKSTASKTLEALILTLLAAVSTNPAKILCVRIILDGLDECDEDTQQRVVNFVGRVVALKVPGARCKVLLCSQDAGKLNKMLKKRKSIALGEESEAVSLAIGVYTKQRLEKMRLNEFSDIDITDADIEYTEATIAKKADGKPTP